MKTVKNLLNSALTLALLCQTNVRCIRYEFAPERIVAKVRASKYLEIGNININRVNNPNPTNVFQIPTIMYLTSSGAALRNFT
jgi:hypothetical protein